jgi:hypothetical protein
VDDDEADDLVLAGSLGYGVEDDLRFRSGSRGMFVLVDQPFQDGFAADTTVGEVRQ